MPRVNTVAKARTDQGKCRACGDELPAGAAYRWIKPRYGSKVVRCLKAECRFRSSDLTSSDKLARVYSAQETLEDAIAGWDGEDGEDVKQALTDAAEEIRDVASEYESSADSIESAFSSSSTADECREKAEALESWADEIESAGDEIPDRPEPEDVDADELTDEQIRAWESSVLAEATTDEEKRTAVDVATLALGGEGAARETAREAIADEINSNEDREPTEAQLDEWRDAVRDAASGPIGDCPV